MYVSSRAVLSATGAAAKVFSLGDNSHVLTAREALAAKGANVGDSAVVIGGGMVGCELALRLTKNLKKKITIVASLPKLLAVNAPICSANKDMLERLVPFYGTEVLCRTTAVKAENGGLTVRNLDTNEERHIPAETILLTVGFKSDQTLYQELQNEPEVYAIGDCKEFHNVRSAVRDAFEVANQL